MERRRMLEYLSGLLAATSAALIGVPGLRYVLGSVRSTQSRGLDCRLARLKDLPPAKPVRLAVKGDRRDAWTVYAGQSLGRVWVIRRTDDKVPAVQSQVEAFLATCPHLRCSVQLDGSGDAFICPCHKAKFHLSGAAYNEQELGFRNPASRGLDPLPCQIVVDAAGEAWVHVQFQDSSRA